MQFWTTNQRASHPVPSVAPRLGYRKPNWSLRTDYLGIVFGNEELFEYVRTIAGIAFTSSCYGGLHLIAWTSAFQSYAALVLWRAASVTIFATGPFCVAIPALFFGFKWIYNQDLFNGILWLCCYVLPMRLGLLHVLRLELRDILILFAFCLSGSFIIWYILCRAFIVVECLILMAHIPESALRVPTWAAYIPSFG